MRHVQHHLLAAVCAVSLSFGGGAHATGVPVIDTTAIAQFVQQLQQAQQAYTTQLEELFNLEQQLNAMIGSRAISGVLNDVTEIEKRASAASLDAIEAAALTGSAMTDLAEMNDAISDIRSKFDLDGINDVLTSSEPIDAAITEQATAGVAAIATAEDTYVRANDAMDRITTLINGIDGNADLKASVDYNTRVMAELAVLLSENLRIQAAQANVAGTNALAQARDNAAARMFNQVGDP